MSKETRKQKAQAIDDQIKKLKEKKANLLQAENAAKRKTEERRKYIIGGIVLEEAKNNPKFLEILKICLNEKLKRDQDKRAFIDYEVPKGAVENRENIAPHMFGSSFNG